jgi:predicted DNA-binding helix-hairpin-helix protein
MDTFEKLSILGDYMQLEPAEEFSFPQLKTGTAADEGLTEGRGCRESATAYQTCPSKKESDLAIFKASVPGGKRIALLKTLLTSACERDCNYCVFRSGRDVARVTFTPDEMARAFMKLFVSRKVEGLFLSSGVAGGGLRTQDRLIATAEILRRKLGFRGYLHLKIMPGAEHAQVERAMQLADRVSINLEAPNTERLAKLAPRKTFFEELLNPLRWAEEIRQGQMPNKSWNGRWPSTCTQFVVGGAGEKDLELLSTTDHLYRQLHLRRAYFSGFTPVPGTPLENHPPIIPWRQHRLYQASFLLRDYHFGIEDLPFSPEGDLPLGADPKLAWARLNLSDQPVEINSASEHELLRVPGIGPKGLQAILCARREGKLRHFSDLRRAGVQMARAAPFLLIDGKRLPQQIELF